MLDGKSIIITGGSSGIGAAAVRQAAAAGALLTIADIDDAQGQALAGEIAAQGGTAQFVQTDIARESEVEALVAAAVSRYGRIDGAFNNAGLAGFSHRPGGAYTKFENFPAEAMRQGFDVNVMGTFFCLKHEMRAMLGTGGGAIVNTSSMVTEVAMEAAPDYISAKHAVIGLTKSAAVDGAGAQIRVNCILPGAVKTPMLAASTGTDPHIIAAVEAKHLMGRLAEPAEIAAAAQWLLSDAASFITGSSMHVDGGMAII